MNAEDSQGAIQDDGVIKEGFLHKRGHRVKNWKKRWCVLRNGTLEYYLVVSEEHGQLKGKINVAGAKVESCADDVYEKTNCFLVHAANDVLVMHADTPKKRDKWVAVLQAVSQCAVQRSSPLFLYTGFPKSWKPKHVTLVGDELSYSEKPDGPSQGSLSLVGSSVSELLPDMVANQPYAFEVTSADNKKLVLRASSALELENWLSTIEDAAQCSIDRVKLSAALARLDKPAAAPPTPTASGELVPGGGPSTPYSPAPAPVAAPATPAPAPATAYGYSSPTPAPAPAAAPAAAVAAPAPAPAPAAVDPRASVVLPPPAAAPPLVAPVPAPPPSAFVPQTPQQAAAAATYASPAPVTPVAAAAPLVVDDGGAGDDNDDDGMSVASDPLAGSTAMLTYSPAASKASEEPSVSMRWGRIPGTKFLDHPLNGQFPTLHFPALMEGCLHVKLVLSRRPEAPPHLPSLNKWQHRLCAQCCETQTTGMFGMKAHYCHYTELLYCTECFGSEMRALPWRVVNELDTRKFRVCTAAAQYLDSVWSVPLVQVTKIDKEVIVRLPHLQRTQELRIELFRLATRAHDPKGRTFLQGLLPEMPYMYDDMNVIPLSDYIRIATGGAVEQLTGATERLQDFVTNRPEVAQVTANRRPKGGWLKKLSQGTSTWLKRWFELDGGVLKYSKKPRSPVKGMLTFSTISSVRMLPDSIGLPFVLLVETGVPEQFMQLQASSDDDAFQWYVAFQAHMGIVPAKESPVPPSGLGSRHAQQAQQDAQAGPAAGGPPAAATPSMEEIQRAAALAASRLHLSSGTAAAAPPAVAAVPKPARMSGYLLDNSSRFSSWKRRWFILDDAMLTWYNAPGEAEVGRLALTRGAAVALSNAKGHQFCVTITIDRTSVQVDAGNQDQQARWYAAIMRHKESA